ncbi:hypothetical protein TMA_097 [Thermus phage TMA]|uniref:hypothetical protein n=1 Tax=Thermus phage TMA TaxID=699370 RepID=UPI00021AADD2|nr:hypothetical protein TMA_097 [Thermus phage TMA]BAK53785.1 hypothetical protein TMA_097 [Thermus phage TMA]
MNYICSVNKKIKKISEMFKAKHFSIVTIKYYYFDNDVSSTISHIYETDLGGKNFEHFLNTAIKASLDQDADRKVKNIKFYDEEKLFFVTNDENGKILFKEINEENIFSFVKPHIEDYFTDFMFLPIMEYDEFFVLNAGFRKLKETHNILGLGFLLTYDYMF